MAKRNQEKELKEYFDHFKSDLSKEIKKYATEKVFKRSRYIFTSRDGKRQYGYCTHCQNSFETAGLKHNDETQCPKCKSRCIVKSSGRGRSKLVDEAYFVYYEKSAKNPDAIVARGIYAVRDYSGLYWDVETKYLETERYIFEIGNSVMLKRHGFYSMAKKMTQWSWGKSKTVYSGANKWNGSYDKKIVITYSRESLQKAVQGTRFRFSTWESYDYEDMVKFFDVYSKYQCVEYLTKLGFGELIKDKLAGRRTYSTVNWCGKNLLKVLRLNKNELNEIKREKIRVNFWFLKLMQMSKKDGSNLSPLEVSQVDIEVIHQSTLNEILRHVSLRKAFGYIQKQCKKHVKHFKSQSQVLLIWKDYISDCIRLEMDLTQEGILFPGNLYRAHQNTIRKVQIKADEKLNMKIGSRLKTLCKQFCFEYQGLMIRPAKSSIELLDEGKALQHCVGTYAQRYADGQNILLFIRRISEPKKPFYTMEIRGKEVIQVRGLKNRLPDEQVEEIVEIFKAEKLGNKKVNSKKRVTA